MTMVTLVLAALVAQDGGCRTEAMAEALRVAKTEVFNLASVARAFDAARPGCPDADVAASYLSGLMAAREAYRAGGSPESLEPVKRAAAELDDHARKGPGPAEIAAAVLRAAAAAAQSERDEMALDLAHATRLELLQLSASQPGTPVVTAHEVAGDLWLQVHRFDDARDAYELAASRIGATPRITLGLARVAARTGDEVRACDNYRALSAWWASRSDIAVEILEAREYLLRPACSGAASGATDKR